MEGAGGQLACEPWLLSGYCFLLFVFFSFPFLSLPYKILLGCSLPLSHFCSFSLFTVGSDFELLTKVTVSISAGQELRTAGWTASSVQAT